MSLHSPFSDLTATVFIKTAKGRAEMVERSAGLKSRQRTVLIMLDGHKQLRDIAILSIEEVVEAVQHLLALDLIAPMDQLEPAVVASAEAAPVQQETVSAGLADIKALMTDSAHTYLGLMAADLVHRVHKARDEIELQSVVGLWHMAMRESKYGRAVAETHLARIRGHFGAASH